jgi:hypothetical protein
LVKPKKKKQKPQQNQRDISVGRRALRRAREASQSCETLQLCMMRRALIMLGNFHAKVSCESSSARAAKTQAARREAREPKSRKTARPAGCSCARTRDRSRLTAPSPQGAGVGHRTQLVETKRKKKKENQRLSGLERPAAVSPPALERPAATEEFTNIGSGQLQPHFP